MDGGISIWQILLTTSSISFAQCLKMLLPGRIAAVPRVFFFVGAHQKQIQTGLF
jgi:hypothetical protein